MQKVAYFRFFNSLNDFLPAYKKNLLLPYYFHGNPSIKDSIEAIGIPHVEIGDINVNGATVGFDYKMEDHIQAEVYPFISLTRPSKPAFIVDVHLGKLAKALRILGFDTAFDIQHGNLSIPQMALKENRIVLSRSTNLLKNKKIKYGYWIRAEDARLQIIEVLKYFNLKLQVEPFVRCLECNGKIIEVSKEHVIDQLPPDTIAYFNQFFKCTSCQKVYWKGSHYERMLSFVEGILKKANN